MDLFWSKVQFSGPYECWEWTASKKPAGYGQFGQGAKYAHRIAYERLIGEIPAGMQLDHLCRNRGCVNPHHLEPVTNQENAQRSPLIGRNPNSHAVLPAEPLGACNKGHEANWHVNAKEYRVCRTCRRANQIRTRGY